MENLSKFCSCEFFGSKEFTESKINVNAMRDFFKVFVDATPFSRIGVVKRNGIITVSFYIENMKGKEVRVCKMELKEA